VSKIWFDVTTILRWSRSPVGIVRVQAECARYALEHLTGTVAFCRFDRRQKRYVSLERDTVRGKIDNLTSESAQPAKLPPSTAKDVAPKTRRSRLAKFTARVLHAFGLGTVTRDLPAEGPIHPFAPGDVYVTVGMELDNNDLALLARMHAAGSLKSIFCCHDTIPVKFPELSPGDIIGKFRQFYVELAGWADEIVCISECTRRDLAEMLQAAAVRVPPLTVIKLGADLPPIDAHASARTRQLAGDRFILFVSTIEPRKNHATLYRAYLQLLERGVGNLPKLIFAGREGWSVDSLLADLKRDPRVAGRIELMTEAGDADLAWLYRHCLFTVYPSLYEGWGLPVAESLAAGKFCLASNAASIPEVGGDLVEYIDPRDGKLWADRLQFYIEHPDALAQAETRIRADYVVTAWHDTAKSLFERAGHLLRTGASING
jgi:glycosyltransferase involved in cell wall biosynthesis